jgi:nucleoside-diphosphate-sugar epimerase
MHTLILGGSGFIGFALAKQLAFEGHRLTLVDNLSRGKMDREFSEFLSQNPEFNFIELDLTEPIPDQLLPDKYNYVFLLAAVVGVKYTAEKPLDVLNINTLIVKNVLDWFNGRNTSKFIFASTSETYAGSVELGIAKIPTEESVPLSVVDIFNPRFSYAISKIWGEHAVILAGEKAGFDFDIVRFHNVYGPRMGMEHVIPELCIRAIKKENPYKVFGTEQYRAFCYIDDAVKGLIVVAKNSGTKRIINIGNDQEEIKISTLVDMILKLGNHAPKKDIHESPKGSVSRRCPDLTTLKSIGYIQKVTLSKGLKLTYQWYKKNDLLG